LFGLQALFLSLCFQNLIKALMKISFLFFACIILFCFYSCKKDSDVIPKNMQVTRIVQNFTSYPPDSVVFDFDYTATDEIRVRVVYTLANDLFVVYRYDAFSRLIEIAVENETKILLYKTSFSYTQNSKIISLQTVDCQFSPRLTDSTVYSVDASSLVTEAISYKKDVDIWKLNSTQQFVWQGTNLKKIITPNSSIPTADTTVFQIGSGKNPVSFTNLPLQFFAGILLMCGEHDNLLESDHNGSSIYPNVVDYNLSGYPVGIVHSPGYIGLGDELTFYYDE
jgi:hypothetical protein